MPSAAEDGAQAVRAINQGWLCAVDSINYVTSAHQGRVILSGSHGGAYSAYKGMSVDPRGLILNDAGGGLNGAGIAVLDLGEQAGLAVATIAHDSARIGNASDMMRRGLVSHANGPARDAGITVGMSCQAALERLAPLSPAKTVLPPRQEFRIEVEITETGTSVVCIDSASLIQPQDQGRVVITGSHGGLIGNNAEKAINVACAFAAFNDAGVGRDAAGLGRLAPLDQRGIPAVTVAHATAEIGNAFSTLTHGVLSHVNDAARRLGAQAGMPLRTFLGQWPLPTSS